MAQGMNRTQSERVLPGASKCLRAALRTASSRAGGTKRFSDGSSRSAVSSLAGASRFSSSNFPFVVDITKPQKIKREGGRKSSLAKEFFCALIVAQYFQGVVQAGLDGSERDFHRISNFGEIQALDKTEQQRLAVLLG